jgi:hypothetical protein
VRRFLALFALSFLGLGATAGAEAPGSGLHGRRLTVSIAVTAPGSEQPGHEGDSANRPLVDYVWSVDTTPAQIGSLDGLCVLPGGTPVQPRFGFLYHLVGTDATGAIVVDRFECVAFANDDVSQQPPAPPIPAVPTFAEAWNSAQLPAPRVTLDPPSRGITGLDTRISTAGPTTVVIAATIRGFTITGTATLDHYEISVDGAAPTEARTGDYTFETKGDHTVAISAIWRGTAVLSGPVTGTVSSFDIGTAAITSTRTYAVREIRSVLQP